MDNGPVSEHRLGQMLNDLESRFASRAESIAENAVKCGIKQAFTAIGINTEDPEAQIEAQQDMAFLRGLRVKTGIVVMTVVAGIGSVALNIWHWVQTIAPTFPPPPHGP